MHKQRPTLCEYTSRHVVASFDISDCLVFPSSLLVFDNPLQTIKIFHLSERLVSARAFQAIADGVEVCHTLHVDWLGC